jgi:hypothetical protein
MTDIDRRMRIIKRELATIETSARKRAEQELGICTPKNDRERRRVNRMIRMKATEASASHSSALMRLMQARIIRINIKLARLIEKVNA